MVLLFVRRSSMVCRKQGLLMTQGACFSQWVQIAVGNDAAAPLCLKEEL